MLTRSCQTTADEARVDLLDDEGLLAIGAAFRAAVDATGAKGKEVELIDFWPTRGRLRVTWTP
jgi:hypothetical protein